MNKQDKIINFKENQLIDLFSGCGGFSKAFIEDSLNEVLYNLDYKIQNIKEYNDSNYKYYLSNSDIDKIEIQKSQLVFQNCNIEIFIKEQEKKIVELTQKNKKSINIQLVKYPSVLKNKIEEVKDFSLNKIISKKIMAII